MTAFAAQVVVGVLLGALIGLAGYRLGRHDRRHWSTDVATGEALQRGLEPGATYGLSPEAIAQLAELNRRREGLDVWAEAVGGDAAALVDAVAYVGDCVIFLAEATRT